MDLELLPEKTPATIRELQARVAAAFERHPLCRGSGRAVGGLRTRLRHPGRLRSGHGGLKKAPRIA
jgi:hypothetical protein